MITAAAPAAPGEPRPWWETRGFVAAMILIAFVPLLYPPIPPLVDLTGHMGRFRVELDLAQSPFLQRYYDYHWALIGNLGVDILVIPMAKLFGIELGTKLIVMCIPPLTVGGFLWVAREVHNRIPPTALFALPFAFGHPFMFGFVNFALAMALAFLAFGLWLRLGKFGKTRLRAALFVPISIVLFFTHTFGWGTLGLLCFSAETVHQHDHGRSWWMAMLRGAMHAAVLAGPLLLILFWRHEAQGGRTLDWFNWEAKWEWLKTALRDRWSLYDRASVFAASVVLVLPALFRKLTISRNLAFSTLVLCAIFIILPRMIFGSAFADMRLVPYIMAVALLSLRFRAETPRRLATALAVLGLTFVLVRTAGTTASMAIASNEEHREFAALDHLPQGARVLFLDALPCGRQWTLPRKSQLGALLIVRKDALVNSEWRMPGAQLLGVRNQQRLGWFANDPSQQIRPMQCGSNEHWPIDKALARFPQSEFDYVWMVDAPPFDPALTAGWQLLYRDGDSMLFRIRPGG